MPAVTGQKQLLEGFGDLASVKYRWNLEGLDPNDERYHDNACSNLTDAQVVGIEEFWGGAEPCMKLPKQPPSQVCFLLIRYSSLPN